MADFTTVKAGQDNKVTDIQWRYGQSAIKRTAISNNVVRAGINSAVQTNGAKVTAVSFGTNVTTLEDYCLYGCSNLTSVYASSGIRSIGNYAFCGCSQIAYIGLSETSKATIGECAYAECATLTAVTLDLAEGGSIGTYICRGCVSLRSAYVKGAASVTEGAFKGCSALASVSIERSPQIGKYAFYGCSSLPSVQLPSGCLEVGEYAFAGCTSLASVAFPAGFTTLASHCFDGAQSLYQLDFSNSAVKQIGAASLAGATGLKRIVMPQSFSDITQVDGQAFASQAGLSVFLPGVSDDIITANCALFTNKGSSQDVTYVSSSGKEYVGTQAGIVIASASNTAYVVVVNTSTTSVNRFHGALLWKDVLESQLGEGYKEENVYWLFDIVGSYNTGIRDISTYEGRMAPTLANTSAVLQEIIDKKYQNLVFIFEDHGSKTSMVTQGGYLNAETFWSYIIQIPGNVFGIIACCYSGKQADAPTQYAEAAQSKNVYIVCASIPSTVSYRGNHTCKYCSGSQHQSNDLTYAIQNQLLGTYYKGGGTAPKAAVSYQQLAGVKYSRKYGSFDVSKQVFEF